MPEPSNAPASGLVAAMAPHREFAVAHGDGEERLVIALATARALPVLERNPASWLDPHEAARIARAVTKRRHEFLLGRFAAKSALAAWHGHTTFAAYTILPGAFEQPVVREPSRADVTLAHTGDAAVAIAHDRGHPLGVDLETLDPARVEVIRSHVAAIELPPPVASLAAEADRMFLIWSVKEALSKALRCGLTCPFELLAVADARVEPEGVCTGTFRNFGQYQFAGWVVAGRTFALVCSRNAQLEPVLPQLRRFTCEIFSAT